MEWILVKDGFITELKEDEPILLMLSFPYMINPGQVYFQIARRIGNELHYEGRFQEASLHFPDNCLSDDKKRVFIPYVKAYAIIEIDSYNRQKQKEKRLREMASRSI